MGHNSFGWKRKAGTMQEQFATSPFMKGELLPLTDGEFSKPGTVMAIMVPGMPFPLLIPESMKYGFVVDLAKYLHGDIVTIKGVWTFVADREDNE